MRHLVSCLLAALVTAGAAPLHAEEDKAEEAGEGGASNDGYCDFVEGVAASESALLMAPQLFGSLGFIDQTDIILAPNPQTSDDLRLTAGVVYRVSGLYQGLLNRSRARAECDRYRAMRQIRGETAARALLARAKVLEDALPQAEKILSRSNADLDERRATAQDVTATRLRVDELRALAATTRRELAALPEPAPGKPMARALETYSAADALVESREGSLRRAQAWDVSVRFGYDAFISNDGSESPYFAVASVGFNLGGLVQGRSNARAASGRKRYVAQVQGPQQLGATSTQMRSTLLVERRRLEETGILVSDLKKQLSGLEEVISDNGRRYRQSMWFDLVKLKAEHAYLEAHVESLSAVVGDGAGGGASDEPGGDE
jgi:hypothetical protein